uniref:EF-hand domain-containing protein n=1 Tax=Chlamydomonas euryale TaxID=1486919 RepID=A0A6U2H5F0_9CHLO|mmetsp:Transcript_37513/g.110863  ORF Transcript_37513/g.110863 Transcript_37513/m.110863 type:complete len:343 (+) Transcript_37513:1301-2329(+)
MMFGVPPAHQGQQPPGQQPPPSQQPQYGQPPQQQQLQQPWGSQAPQQQGQQYGAPLQQYGQAQPGQQAYPPQHQQQGYPPPQYGQPSSQLQQQQQPQQLPPQQLPSAPQQPQPQQMASAPQEPAAQMPSAPQAGQAGSHAGSHAGYPPVSGGSSVLQAPGAVTVSAPMAPGPMPTDPSQVAGYFSQIDVNRNGLLDAEELQKALAIGGLHYGVNDTDLMVTAFDSSGSRALTLTEFQSLHQFLTSTTDKFKRADVRQAGTLGVAEVGASLREAGFTIDTQALDALIKRYDRNRTGALALDQFIRLSLFMHSATRTFSAFDTQRSNKVQFNFSQFIYASSHVV